MKPQTVKPQTAPSTTRGLAQPGATPSIRSERLWSSLMALASVGATAKGGVRRLALTDLDRQGRDLVCGWLREVGCQLVTDPIGNIFATRPGRLDLAPVAIGSHIDTQPSGGRFDGNYGVLAGLEVLRALDEASVVTDRPVAVAIWTNEEGSRFTPVMMGSGVYAGAFNLESCLAQRDLEGISVAQALQSIGYAGTGAPPKLAAYFEPHIEQGPVLEAEGITVGAVTGALGQRWFDLKLIGQDAHAGPTPLAMRRDALLGAARIVAEVRRIARHYPNEARGTVGQLIVSPNSRNVIPGLVRMTVDLRNAQEDTLAEMAEDLRVTVARIAAEERLEATLEQVVHFSPCHFDSHWTDRIEALARELGHSVRRLPSGAGHDAVYVARSCPAAMIFVPCEGGISHNEIENARPEHLAAGAQVLLRLVLEASQATSP
jgi:N-carbamoyl-L-amino-acid hydrolase